MDNQTPQAFQQMIVAKYPGGVSSSGTPYAQMDPNALIQSVVAKYPKGVTNAGIPYSNYLPRQSGVQNQGGFLNGLSNAINAPLQALAAPILHGEQAVARGIGKLTGNKNLVAAGETPISVPGPWGNINVAGGEQGAAGAEQMGGDVLNAASYALPAEGAEVAGEKLLGGQIGAAAAKGAGAGALFGGANMAGSAMQNGGSVGNVVGSGVLGGIGGAAVGALTPGLLGGAGAMINAIGGAKQSATDIMDSTMHTLANKYTGTQGMLSGMERKFGTNPVGVISSYAQGKAMPELIDGKINPDNAIDFLKQKIGELSGIKTDAVEANNIGVPLDSIQKEVDSTIANQGWSQAKQDEVSAQTNKLLNGTELADGTTKGGIANSYPKGYLPLTEVDTIKSEQTALSKAFNNSGAKPFELDAHGIVGRAAKTIVENATNDAPTQELNKLIQSHYNAVDLLEALRGKAPKGGMLTRQLSRVGGEIIGGGVGSMVGHPVIGALAGRVVSDKLDDIFGNALISNPLKRQLIEKMTDDSTSPVVKKMLDYLDGLEASRAQRLALPAAGQAVQSPMQGTGEIHTMASNLEDQSAQQAATAMRLRQAATEGKRSIFPPRKA